ncbi:hypothetical protein LOTGIDRAFT_157103 [Lottia gigantea]|uniref:Uncharacterized protein n=1 Tax=Lottia gigantea TaxID=225164 RepID=V4AD98_LOTGI|nr:hypothetical protein LOTGIDRAFT_157103 [Lottia gigantea]ESP01969.1 hypothetical protein LOTGIDRAFT_157103 [Lottia gigantea]
MNTEDIRKICVKKKLVEATTSLVRFDVDLKREELKIDFQRRQMLNNFLREKESVLNDFVHINVRTPKSGISFSPCVTPLRRSSTTLNESDDWMQRRRYMCLEKPTSSRDLSFEKQIAPLSKPSPQIHPNWSYSSRSGQLNPINSVGSLQYGNKWARKHEKAYARLTDRPPITIPTINLDGSTAVMRPNSTTNGRRVLLSAKVSSRLKRADAIMKSLQSVSTLDDVINTDIRVIQTDNL